MAYNRKTAGSGPDSLGFGGGPIDLSGGDYTVPDTVKGIVVVATGNVICRALNGSADVTITGATVGMHLPFHCLAIRQTGTTATLAEIIG